VKANRLKPSSTQSYEDIFRVHLIPEFGTRRLDEIGNELVQRFKGELVEDELANKTINDVLTALSVTLKRAVDWNVIPAMPCRIRLLKVNRGELAFYDFGDYQRFVEAAEALDPRIELLVLLGGDAGLRRGEAIGLEWTDVDLRRRAMHVSEADGGPRSAPRLRGACSAATLGANGWCGWPSGRRNRWRRLGDGDRRRHKAEERQGVGEWGARDSNPEPTA
jgi:integrase